MNSGIRVIAGLALAGLTACSGGGSTPVSGTQEYPSAAPSASAVATPAARTTLVTGTIIIPAVSNASAAVRRGRKYVPPSTSGLVVRIDQITSNVPTEYSDTGYALTTNLTTTSGMSTCKSVSATAVACTVTFNAPVTTATQTDAFYLYAYTMSQTVGALPTTYVPSGSLVAEDVGSGTGDPVPGGANANGIPPGQSTALTFNLLPVVAKPLASIGATVASASAPLVLSVPGTGGSSNVVDIDGTDAAGNNIATYLSGNSDDDTYANPMSASVSPSQFTLTSPFVGLVNQQVAVTYKPAPGDQPATPASTPLEGTLTATASFFGGFHDTSSFPTETQTIGVAPLYAVSQALTGTGQSGYEIYAVQAALPTGVTGTANYSLSGTPTVTGSNDCADYTVSSPAAMTGGAIRASFEADYNAVAGAAAGLVPCTFVLSDGIVQVKVTEAAPTL